MPLLQVWHLHFTLPAPPETVAIQARRASE